MSKTIIIEATHSLTGDKFAVALGNRRKIRFCTNESFAAKIRNKQEINWGGAVFCGDFYKIIFDGSTEESIRFACDYT